MDLENMMDEELYSLIDNAKTVIANRQTRQTVNDQVAEVLRTARASEAISTPEVGAEWVQPT
ncbi:MAG: hypothetical protein L0H03_23550, partial [Rhodococcus sp. (in: high G+C Gram-positive bacteria)]|nr:hypothetical protein [Rhodococcus sp. (in: high G+C Gram-positive bacteria)]